MYSNSINIVVSAFIPDYWWGRQDDWQHAPGLAEPGGEGGVQLRKWSSGHVHLPEDWTCVCYSSEVSRFAPSRLRGKVASVDRSDSSYLLFSRSSSSQKRFWWRFQQTSVSPLQSVSSSDATAEAAVLCHTHPEPREAAAAGPPSASTLQLRQQPQQPSGSGWYPQTWPIRLPPRFDGKTWAVCFREGVDAMMISNCQSLLSRRSWLYLYVVFRSTSCLVRWAKSLSSSSTSSCAWSSAPSFVSPTPERRLTGWRSNAGQTWHEVSTVKCCVKESACVFSLRLYLLVQLFGGVQAAEFSSRLSPGERKKTLKEFEQGKIELWVCLAAFVKNNESYIYIYTGIRYCVGDSKLR